MIKKLLNNNIRNVHLKTFCNLPLKTCKKDCKSPVVKPQQLEHAIIKC
jgi:hypothetical protein